ncbi:MAG: hypothetical protein PHE26_08690 [Syntrophomonadaceae bacterium]|nr:hypothetical protein [Syntrophomonadaceae bacterium]
MKRILNSFAFFTILLVLLSLTACSAFNKVIDSDPQNNEPPEQKLSDYFPLTAGSSWEYEGIGNEYASFTREVVFTQGKLAQIKESNGGTVSTSIFDSADDSIIRVYFAGETYHPENLLPDKFSPGETIILLNTPLKVGTSWKEGEVKKEISQLDASTDTPAGKFEHCLLIKTSGKDYSVFEYYSKGIGLVKREFNSGGAQIISQLEKYDIR